MKTIGSIQEFVKDLINAYTEAVLSVDSALAAESSSVSSAVVCWKVYLALFND